MLMDPYIEKVLGRSGFEPDLWKRRYHAYSLMIAQGVMTRPREDDKDEYAANAMPIRRIDFGFDDDIDLIFFDGDPVLSYSSHAFG